VVQTFRVEVVENLRNSDTDVTQSFRLRIFPGLHHGLPDYAAYALLYFVHGRSRGY